MLRDVSLDTLSGEKICIVGGTAENREALVDLLSAEILPDDGQVLMHGVDVGVLSRKAIRTTTTTIGERPRLIEASIVENIALGLAGVSRHQVDWAAEQALVSTFAHHLPNGLDTIIGDEAQTVSSQTANSQAANSQDSTGSRPRVVVPTLGQRRRIALARALLQNADLLIVNEPTSGLGINEERLVIDALNNVVRGRTLIAVSQRVTVARKVDRVLVLEDASLAEYNETETRGTNRDHAKLWSRPPTQSPTAKRQRRVVPLRSSPSPPATEPWGVSVGSEIVPGFVATGLVARTRHTDIWAAWSQAREAPVRVKIPAQAPVSWRAHVELRNESKVMSSLRHAGIAQCHRYDMEASLPFAVFELLDTPTLETVAIDEEGLDPLDVFHIGFELAESLHYMHKRGYAHLDLRPRHLQTRSGTVVIMDCSQALRIGQPLPQPEGTGSGRRGEHTAQAPEQRPGAAATEQMDMYSLGALLHFAAAGRVVTRKQRPIRLNPFSQLVTDGPSQLISLVDRMLAPDPADRPTAEEALARFRQVLPQSMHHPRVGNLDDAPALRLVVSNN